MVGGDGFFFLHGDLFYLGDHYNFSSLVLWIISLLSLWVLWHRWGLNSQTPRFSTHMKRMAAFFSIPGTLISPSRFPSPHLNFGNPLLGFRPKARVWASVTSAGHSYQKESPLLPPAPWATWHGVCPACLFTLTWWLFVELLTNWLRSWESLPSQRGCWSWAFEVGETSASLISHLQVESSGRLLSDTDALPVHTYSYTPMCIQVWAPTHTSSRLSRWGLPLSPKGVSSNFC